MELDKKDAAVVDKAIASWVKDNTISPELASSLRSTVTIRNSNVDAITVYALISAVSCGLLAFGALVIDEKWIELLRKKWGFSETVVGIGFTLLAMMFIFLARRRKRKFPDASASNETYNITIALTIGIAITYWTRSFASFDGNYALPILLAAIAYGAVAVMLESRLLWLSMIIALAGWWGAQTHLWSEGNYRFAGMNYPLRMTVFGLAIWGSYWLVKRIAQLRIFADPTYTAGLVLFLFAAWTLSIFGNYDDYQAWNLIKQSHFWYWSLGFTLVLAMMIAYSFQTNQNTLRDVSLVFFLLNIYTRYFEYFWDRTNKGIFFALMALSFWLVARKAEQWHRKEKKAV
jgi:hypothetical protein